MSEGDQGKSKAQLRKERREKQEAQRAAKAVSKAKGSQPAKQHDNKINNDRHVPKPAPPANLQQGPSTSKQQKEHSKSSQPDQKGQPSMDNLNSGLKRVTFAPSGTFEDEFSTLNASSSVHPSFIQLGIRCAHRIVTGVDAQCVALIEALIQFVTDYDRPSDKVFGRDIEMQLKPQMSFLTSGIPLPPALGNLIKQLKHQINEIPNNTSDEKARATLLEWLSDFVSTKVELSFQTISLYTRDKLKGCPVILTYCWCPLVEKILIDAKQEGVNFKVFVLDCVPDQSGKKMLHSLLEEGIECSYGLINSLAYVIKECSLVLLGASAILANGNVLTHEGSSQLCLVSRAHNVPVLVPSPTYKFTEKVHTGSLAEDGGILHQEAQEVIPSHLISALVTELRIVPPSSAPAVLREVVWAAKNLAQE